MIKQAIKKGDFVKCEIESMNGKIFQVVMFTDLVYLVEVEKIANGLESLNINDFWKVSGKYFAANFTKVENEPAPAPATLENPAEIEETPKHGKAPKGAKFTKATTAAAVVLLSLTIGQGKPAQIYTDNPAAVLAEVANAGETVTAYTIARA